MSTAADPSLLDLQTIPSWDKALATLGSGPFAKGVSERLRGTVLPPPNVFDVRKDDAPKNCCVYAAGYLSVLPAYLPTIVGAAVSMGGTISLPSGQQWRNFLIGLKRHFPDPPASSNIKVDSRIKRPAPSASTSGPSAKRPRSFNPQGASATSSSPSPSTAGASTPSVLEEGEVASGKATSSGKRKIHPLHELLPILSGSLKSVNWVSGRIPILSVGQLQAVITKDVLAEIRWHVHEQSFRFELLVLDQVLCPSLWRAGEGDSEEVRSARKERELAIRRVFPAVGSLHDNVFVKEIPNADGGVASRRWPGRAPYFLAFRDVVVAWPDCPETIRNTSFNSGSDFDMMVLEEIILKEYCSRFLQQFGRPPIPPVRLPFVSTSRKSPASFYRGLYSVTEHP